VFYAKSLQTCIHSYDNETPNDVYDHEAVEDVDVDGNIDFRLVKGTARRERLKACLCGIM